MISFYIQFSTIVAVDKVRYQSLKKTPPVSVTANGSAIFEVLGVFTIV